MWVPALGLIYLLLVQERRSGQRDGAEKSVRGSVEAMAAVDVRRIATDDESFGVYYHYRMQSWINYCTVLAARFDWNSALDEITRALSYAQINNTESEFECLCMRGYYLIRLGQYLEAISDLRNAIDLLKTQYRCYPLILYNAQSLLMYCLRRENAAEESDAELA